MSVEKSSTLLKRFTPEYDVCLWNYFEDSELETHLEVVNYLTNQSIKPLELQSKQCHYIFYKNFDQNKLFILYKNIGDIKNDYTKGSFRGASTKDTNFLGLNTRVHESKLSAHLNAKNITSIN